MKKLYFALMMSLMANSSWAQVSNFRYHILKKPTVHQQTEYSVIQEDLSLKHDQNRISQQVIYRKISSLPEVNLLNEAQSFLDNKQILLTESTRAGKVLWTPIKNTWSSQDEVNYQTWFKQNASAEFVADTSFNVDCADLGLLLRWAYAHDKKLPIANTLTGSGKLFGHFSSSSSWDSLPTHAEWKKDERFKAAMKYLFSNTYTGTVYNDLYPTLINPTYVHPGSIYMIIGSTSRTQNIHKVDAVNGSIRTLWGNHPASKKIYESALMWNPATKNRFGSWRWPVFTGGVWTLTAGNKMPGYSEEQYTQRKNLGETAFRQWVLNRLK